jgi:phenylpropionate dioxygenase-like ring-hydroxylating dioxygenase large terminal subunit
VVSRRLRHVPSPIDEWFPVLASKVVGLGQIATTRLLGQQIVIYRGFDGTLGAFEDRCPHRGVNLSLGKVNHNGLQCSYHGWTLDPKGKVCSAPGIGALDVCAQHYAVHEAHGLIWLFAGAPEVADTIPLHGLSPYGTAHSVDVRLSVDVRTHWSFALDNGMDLFHHHLHAGMPFFFKVYALQECKVEDCAFIVRYSASLRDIYNRPRDGTIQVRAERNMVCLDFDGLPVIFASATPRSANGAEITVWWMISFPVGSALRFIRKLWTPGIAYMLMRAFRQDTEMLESEQAAFERTRKVQYEVNPVIRALHDYLETVLIQRTEKALSRGVGVTEVQGDDILPQIQRSELAVLICRDGRLQLAEPAEVITENRTLAGTALRYQHVCILKGA